MTPRTDQDTAAGHAARPRRRPRPGRRARRLHPPRPAPPHRPAHRPGRTGAHPVRPHPRHRLPILRRAGQDTAGRPVPRGLAPGHRTRHHPRPGRRRTAHVGRAPRRHPAAARPRRSRRAGHRRAGRAGRRAGRGNHPLRPARQRPAQPGPPGATGPPGGARTPRTCPGAPVDADARSARPTPRRTARRSGRPCSSP